MKEKIRGLWKILFGRTTIYVLLILLQILILFGGALALGSKVIVINNIVGLCAVILIFYILSARQNTSFKLMWSVFIVATPIIGVTFYLLTRIQPGIKHIEKRLEMQLEDQSQYLLPDASIMEKLKHDVGRDCGIFRFIAEEGSAPAYYDCGMKYFPLGDDKFVELVAQLKKAENFIFLEYFIIDRGEMWDTVLAILKEKVEQGVEVRVLYDGTNMMLTLPRNYPEYLRSLGIQCRIFSPMKPFLTTHQNNRDHRKIAVIDGHTAFTGGINLADEYINRKKRFGHWKDTAIMVKGKAVDSFTLMFLRMWNINDPENVDYEKYMFRGVEKDNSLKYGGYTAPYSSSPYASEMVGKKVYLDILNKASDYVHIMTPYLILEEETINAMCFAAQRGVDVKLILPHIPDKKYAYVLARAHYAELIICGVKIYEYTPGFVHAKVFTSDDIKAVVGTINLDYRSLYLHFECAQYVWGNPVVNDIEEDFHNTLLKCQRITLKNCEDYSLFGKICGRVLRIIAPLM